MIPKESVKIVYTGEGKGKTGAGLGLVCRALGAGHNVAFIQFIKKWQVSEDKFFTTVQPLYKNKLTTYKGGLGFYNAGKLSAKNISCDEHKRAALDTLAFALECASSGKYDLVVCDEINNAVHDGLIKLQDVRKLLSSTHVKTSICLTGRDFPVPLIKYVDIISDIHKVKHHYDEGSIAKSGIDY